MQDQYSFIYTVMYDSLTVGRTRIAFEEFLVKYQTLKDDFPGIIEKQFKVTYFLVWRITKGPSRIIKEF